MITVTRAAELMELETCTLQNKKGKYFKYYHKPSPGEKNARFDYERYKRDEDNEQSIIAQVQLLVEYLAHIEGIKYTEISKAAKVTLQSISSLNYGINAALKIARWCRDEKQYEFIRYHKYYGYSTDKIIKGKK